MKALLAAVAISALPFAASAATYYIDVNSEGPYTSGFQTLSVGDELVFVVTPNTTYTFDFGISALGQRSSLEQVTFGTSVSGSYSTVFNTYGDQGSFWSAGGDLPNLTTGETFSVAFLSNGATSNVSIALAFTATQQNEEELPVPSEVPLPAAGGLLVTGMLGLGALARRRKA